MSQQRYTHHLYSYRTDATYSVNTHSPPPLLRSLTPSVHPSPFLPPPVLSSNCLSLTICILLLPVTCWLLTHTDTQVLLCTHTSSSEQMSFLHMLLLIAPLLTHHFLFIIRWVHTGCPRQPSIYIVIETGVKVRGGRGEWDRKIERDSYDSSQYLDSPSHLPGLLFQFYISEFSHLCSFCSSISTTQACPD